MKIDDLLVKRTCAFLLIVLSVFFARILSASDENGQAMRKAAIFVENRSGKALNDKVIVLEDLITSRITEKGFSVLSREVVINAINTYNDETAKATGKPKADPIVSSDNSTATQIMSQFVGTILVNDFSANAAEGAKAAGSGTEPPGAKPDQRLSNNASLLRLAQMMGVDYIITASITSFGTEKRIFKGYGARTINLIHYLRVSYKILEAVQGGSLVADTGKVSKTMRSTEYSETESNDILNELLDDASVMVAESLGKKHIIQPPPKPNLVEITIACGMQDLAQLPVTVPDVRLTEDHRVVIENNNLDVHILDATVELNGAVIGSAPGTFKAPPGLSKINVSREGFKDWERTINVMEGLKLKVVLQMNEAGYQRWKDNTAFLYRLKKDEKLTDAEVKALEGKAQMFRQSGFRVDVKGDIKLDSKGVSLFGMFD